MRPGGKWVPVIAVDQLPTGIELQGLPREIDPRLLDLERFRTIHLMEPDKISSQTFELATHVKKSYSAPTTPYLPPDAKARGIHAVPQRFSDPDSNAGLVPSITTPSAASAVKKRITSAPLPSSQSQDWSSVSYHSDFFAFILTPPVPHRQHRQQLPRRRPPRQIRAPPSTPLRNRTRPQQKTILHPLDQNRRLRLRRPRLSLQTRNAISRDPSRNRVLKGPAMVEGEDGD